MFTLKCHNDNPLFLKSQLLKLTDVLCHAAQITYKAISCLLPDNTLHFFFLKRWRIRLSGEFDLKHLCLYNAKKFLHVCMWSDVVEQIAEVHYSLSQHDSGLKCRTKWWFLQGRRRRKDFDWVLLSAIHSSHTVCIAVCVCTCMYRFFFFFKKYLLVCYSCYQTKYM